MIHEVKLNGRTRNSTRMPTRYLGSALVARGFWDGWRHESRTPPGDSTSSASAPRS